ncbi:hypothetical protein [Paenibacillus sp. HB172176]|uniref:hypothetical protein n=1 Tax=Paenibacillus sp. HB172176 TaxID=2493690 RepID=UPI001439A521|nr:hypothetical protein [Paenibacillus sp. HB172176]
MIGTERPWALSGVFHAERFWREPGLSQLPQLADKQAERMVAAMDELMFCLARPGDYVLTRQPMHAAHLDYLFHIGFDFHNEVCDTEDENGGSGELPLLPAACSFRPFAVLPHHKRLSELLGIAYCEPEPSIIQRVNGKCYSAAMRTRLELANPARVAFSAAEVFMLAQAMLEKSPVLLKDDYGVSGKGILRVNEEAALRRIVGYLAAQEEQGCHTRLIIEPLLPKTLDFSALLHLSKDGELRVESVQQMLNKDFAFRGIMTPNASFVRELEETGYPELMERIGREMHRDGYWGDICVDSMRLEGNEWTPIVEINARKSMSHMKNGIDAFVAASGMQALFTHYPLAYKSKPSYEQLLDRLSRKKLLFERMAGKPGILPLSANTLLAGGGLEAQGRGRLYAAIVYRTEEQCRETEKLLEEIFAELELRLLN